MHFSTNECKTVTVIIPFLNERENLPLLWDRIKSVMAREPERLEVIWVDDGSNDGSGDWVSELCRRESGVNLIQLSRNFGHQIAITAGVDHAKGDAVIIMDADLQDPPEVIPQLLAKWREGYEVVYAVRNSRQGESWTKRLCAGVFYRAFKILVKNDLPLDAGEFRLIDRQVVDALKQVRELHRFMRGLTCWAGYRQCAVVYDRHARHAGQSKYSFVKSTMLAWDAVTCFSGAPLRWMMFSGFLVASMGIAHAFFLLVKKILDPTSMVTGWATVVCLILLLGGFQLFCMGLLGQYVSHIFDESKQRPLYFVRNRPSPPRSGSNHTTSD